MKFLKRCIAGTVGIFAMALTLWFWLAQPQSNPDRYILSAGDVITLDENHASGNAVYVEDGIIRAVGDFDALQGAFDVPTYGEGTGIVLPGLIEPHTHPIASAMLGATVNISASTHSDRSSVMTTLRDAADGVMLTPWFVAWGWDPVAVEGMHPPTLAELDAISPDKPMLILTQMLHEAFANSAALTAAGLPLSHGAALHELEEVNKVVAQIPPATDPVVEFLLRRQYQAYASAGFTEIGIAGAVGRHPDPVNLLQRVGNRAQAPVGTHLYLLDDQVTDETDLGAEVNFKVPGVKFWLDGSPFTGGAATAEPYSNSTLVRQQLGLSHNHSAEVLMDENGFYKQALPYHRDGRQIAVHVQGEEAVELALNVFERLQNDAPQPGLRHRLEHNALITSDQLERARDLGVTTGFFVDHITWYGHQLDALFGLERAARYMPLGWAAEYGLTFTLHGDHPATPLDPFQTMETAVTRRGPNGQVVGSEQALTPEQALRAMTLNAAVQLGVEDRLGSISVGKQANFTIVDANPLAVSVDNISDIQVLQTIRNGQIADTRAIAEFTPKMAWRILMSML
ncbi:amidohydrolase [Halocynthiibacter namhaensis]|uniref:amidohydrolase n=1 Tax=Halocynthiibacter namhaensis TaxID=1290553 RepID=UPI00057952DE|nr:amidohydrolase [Halocynthiibacter namhaensis]